jgi:hypothetical protein
MPFPPSTVVEKFKRSQIRWSPQRTKLPLSAPSYYHGNSGLSSGLDSGYEVGSPGSPRCDPSRAKRDIKALLTCMQNGAVGNTLSMGRDFVCRAQICLVWWKTLSSLGEDVPAWCDMILPSLASWSWKLKSMPAETLLSFGVPSANPPQPGVFERMVYHFQCISTHYLALSKEVNTSFFYVDRLILTVSSVLIWCSALLGQFIA